MNKIKFLLIAFATITFAKDSSVSIGIVNFAKCITDSKIGKKEQENLENVRIQWTSLIEETNEELSNINSKLENPEYLEGISPQVEEDMKIKKEMLSKDLQKYETQIYQALHQAQMLLIQKMSSQINKASEELAKKTNFKIILNAETCLYNIKSLDVTDDIIKILDNKFEKENKK
ncbi:MAG: hypothetical protein AMS24_02770 [Chlamydiae bacterium SM23_39]|nr:MAG: hypothetical protein AMS24_02770 [Chlamydiae bacterium SM23_39]